MTVELAAPRAAGAPADEQPAVLVVSDRAADAQLLGLAVRAAGYRLVSAVGAGTASQLLLTGAVEVAIVDLHQALPGGPALCRAVRAHHRAVPILALTGAEPVVDYLDAGADDCLARPYALPELLARVRALRRRSHHPHRTGGPPGGTGTALRYADVWLDPVGHQATRDGRRLDLTRTEFSLLETFLRRPRHVLSPAVLLRQAWGAAQHPPATNTVAVYVGYLRRKLEDGDRPRLIHTVRGTGYALRDRAP
jgi:two-component system response regulator MprA